MKSLQMVRGWSIVLLLLFLLFSACHRSGGQAPAPLPTTVLTVGAPVSDTVVRSTFNAYSAAVNPGSLYKISVTGLADDVDLNVYDTDNTFTHPIACPIDNGSIIGTSPEDCILIPSGNTLYFGVDGKFTAGAAAAYTIDVELLPERNPTLSIPSADATTQREAVAYSVVPPSPGAYTVSATGLIDDVDLHVFLDNGGVVTPATCAPPDNTLIIGKSPEDCTLNVTTSGTVVFFIVDGIFSSAVTAQYTVLVTPAPSVSSPANEGSTAFPVNILVDTPSTTGQVGSAGTSRYQAAGLIPGSRYTISITGLTAAADLIVFGGDNTFTTRVGCVIENTAALAGTLPESCTFPAPPGGTAFFEVATGAVNGASYIILVEPGP